MPDTPARLKVAVVSHMYPQRGREGYGVFVSEQTRALVDAGACVTCVAVPVPRAPWPLPALSATWQRYAAAEHERTDFGSVPVRLPRYTSFPRKALRTISASSASHAIARDETLASALRDSDVILAHSALLDGRVARDLSTRFGKPYAVVVHGEDLYQNASVEGLRSSIAATLGDAAAVVAVSGALARGLAEAFGEIGQVSVVHNGVDTERFAPAAAGAASDATPAAGPLHILTASHLVKRKAQAYLLRALATLVSRGIDAVLTIAGDGPERASLVALARELGLQDRVFFLGSYRNEELPALLRDCDLFALPSWDEAFGVVYLEALACGVPVVAADDGGAPEIVTDGADGYLVPPRDDAALAEAIARFAALDDGARTAMRSAARATALRFTWDANAAALLGVLEEAVAANRTAAEEGAR